MSFFYVINRSALAPLMPHQQGFEADSSVVEKRLGTDGQSLNGKGGQQRSKAAAFATKKSNIHQH